jgi:hypothetical protein
VRGFFHLIWAHHCDAVRYIPGSGSCPPVFPFSECILHFILHFVVVADLETNRVFSAKINCTEWGEQQAKESDEMISCPIPQPPTNVKVSVGPAAGQLMAIFEPVRKLLDISLLTNACCTSATRAHAHHPLRIPSAAEEEQYIAGPTEALGGQWRGGQWREGEWREVPYFIPADDREFRISLHVSTLWSSEERA